MLNPNIISINIKRLYEDRVIGKLTDDQFMEISKNYEAESTTLNMQLDVA